MENMDVGRGYEIKHKKHAERDRQMVETRRVRQRERDLTKGVGKQPLHKSEN